MRMRIFTGFLALTALTGATLAACGGSTETSTTGTSGTGGAATTSSGTATTSSSSGSTSSSSGTGGAPDCTQFVFPAPPTSPVTVRVVNKGTGPVYLGQTMPTCATALGFSLEDGAMKALQPARQPCEYTCQELQAGTCACADGCAAPIVTKLAPDGYLDFGWPGTVFEQTPMPASCFADQGCAAGGCLNEKAAPAGPLTMKSSAWTMPAGCNGACPDCTPGTKGNCIINGATSVTGTEIKAQAMWMGEGVVQIQFMGP